jgi:L-iditol 2-dehydrogenase
MKAAVVLGPANVSLKELPIPKIGCGEILVKMVACGICGTDIEKLQSQWVTPPILGHEVVGEIAKVGKDVKNFKVGDRVFVHHHVPDYTCYYCKRGDFTMCDSFQSTNLDPCGFAEYFRVPEPNVRLGAVLKLPEKISYEEGVLIEPIACCIRGLMKCKISSDDKVLVIGAGPIGLMHIHLLKVFGAGMVIASDLINWRLEMAVKFGASHVVNPNHEDFLKCVQGLTGGKIGPDIVIVTVGSSKAIQQGMDVVRKGGKVCIFGVSPPKDMFTYDVNKMLTREISIIPSYSTSELETNMALKMMLEKQIEAAKFITHHFKLEQIKEALDCTAEKKDSLKVIVKCR